MTVSTMELKLNAIRDDTGLSRAEKIAKVERLRNEARALQRAATESAMVEDDGWYEDVHLIDTELENLGRTVEEKGAATL
ncbi:hypothetical protein MUO32_09205 [Shinella sp. CPCC 101442]|uniref:hypothetical protein n=1 Tax=Shinella sp. CPCC 101442 TaxID=2932265 RepID=UPI0021527980|nr:hypothetical protein [Shinella sp. CPCC 101442]MCR6499206.1 hypothetical protein [Shinella sp. CPCC 101442]